MITSPSITSATTKTVSVGERLKFVREKYGFSQRELARRADVTNGTLSNIELGRVSPAIASLEKILNAVPMSLQEFFSDNLEVAPAIFRADQFVEIHKNDTDYRILPLSETNNNAYLAKQTYSPGAKVTSEWMVHDGTIAGIVVVGSLDVVLDGVKYVLKTGDGFNFSIHRPHAFLNSSTRDCVVVSVSFND